MISYVLCAEERTSQAPTVIVLSLVMKGLRPPPGPELAAGMGR